MSTSIYGLGTASREKDRERQKRKQKHLCQMCARNLSGHPACRKCHKLLETELSGATLCRCGKYHNAPSRKDKRYCRLCKGEEVPTGEAIGETPSLVEDGEEEINEVIET